MTGAANLHDNKVERLSLIINKILTHVSSFALVFLMLLTVADVFGRYILNRPVPGTFELTEMLMVPIVFLALGLAQHYKEHIALDLAYNYYSPRLKKATDVIVDVVSLMVAAAIAWQLYAYAFRMSEGNYTTAVLQLPLLPFVVVALAGAVFYMAAVLCDLGGSIKKLLKE